MTIVTVFGQSVRQLLDLFLQLFDLLFERQQFGHLGFERRIFFAQRLHFFFLCHSPTLPGFHCFGKSLALPNSYHYPHIKHYAFCYLFLVLEFEQSEDA